MCEIFARQDPEQYKNELRSLRLAGRSTSIRLERKFWQILDEIAESQDLSTPRFLSTLYDEVIEIHGEVQNFASLLRVTCMIYKQETEAGRMPELAPQALTAAE